MDQPAVNGVVTLGRLVRYNTNRYRIELIKEHPEKKLYYLPQQRIFSYITKEQLFAHSALTRRKMSLTSELNVRRHQ